MKALEIVERAKAAVEPELAARGLEIVDIEYKREPVGMVLRFFIDRPSGIDLNACAEASDVISGLLDNSDILKSSYTLEVSSPGVERRLTKPEHFERFVGSKVVVKANISREGRKRFTGILAKAGAVGFSLDTGAGVVEFKYTEVARAKLIFSD